MTQEDKIIKASPVEQRKTAFKFVFTLLRQHPVNKE